MKIPLQIPPIIGGLFLLGIAYKDDLIGLLWILGIMGAILFTLLFPNRKQLIDNYKKYKSES